MAAPVHYQDLGWEIPFGKIEDGETSAAAAAREFEEETGWRPAHPGLSDSEHHVFRANSAEPVGDPADGMESDRAAWVPLASVRSLIDKGEITSGSTAAALLYLICDSGSGPLAGRDFQPGG
jgi:predicted NUDIX family NTP pyrophosphohydrolase